MPGTSPILEEFESCKTTDCAASAQEATAAQQRLARMNALKARIRSGESTGERVTDFLIVSGGHVFPKVADYFREIDKKITERQGEFVMVIREDTRLVQEGGCFGGSITDTDTRLTLALLGSGGLIFDLEKCDWGFPTRRRAVNRRPFVGPSFVTEGCIMLDIIEQAAIYSQLGIGLAGSRGRFEREVTILIGNDETDAWLSDTTLHPLRNFDQEIVLMAKSIGAGLSRLARTSERLAKREAERTARLETLRTRRTELLAQIAAARRESEVVAAWRELRQTDSTIASITS
jgi:hypothetical protein